MGNRRRGVGKDVSDGAMLPYSSLHGIFGGHKEGMSATAFQRKRRELREQTSAASRMNEEGPGDPYAKTTDNYDQQEIKDQGIAHQEGDPPPFSLTGHVPEELDPGAVEGVDPGTRQQEGDPPPYSVTLRQNEEPKAGVEGDEYEDQRRYAALDKRESAHAQSSQDNVELYPAKWEGTAFAATGYSAATDPANQPHTAESSEVGNQSLESKTVPELRDIAAEEGVEGRSSMKKDELMDAIRERRNEGDEG
jgi:hypothetical protein